LCTIKDPNLRPSSAQLLKHPFVSLPGSTNILVDIIEQCKLIQERGPASQSTTENAVSVPSDENMSADRIRDDSVMISTFKKLSTISVSDTMLPLAASHSGTVVVHKASKEESVENEHLMTVRTINAEAFLEDAPPPPKSIENDFGLKSRVTSHYLKRCISNLNRFRI
jgi:hypothetical protein